MIKSQREPFAFLLQREVPQDAVSMISTAVLGFKMM